MAMLLMALVRSLAIDGANLNYNLALEKFPRALTVST
jgi:hypothetical protein